VPEIRDFNLFPSFFHVGIEFELALALGALGVLVRFFIAEFYFRTEAPWAFEVRKGFLDTAPLVTRQFHSPLLVRMNPDIA
jgi:hypothetical protein